MDKRITASVIVGLSLAGTVSVDRIVDPFVSNVDSYEIGSQSVVKDGGDVGVKLMKDKPEVRLSKWGGDAEIAISYDKVKGKGARKALTNRVEWKGTKEEVHAYPLPAGELMEDGGFEIEVVLAEKPTTNVFEFSVAGYEDLDFFYQMPLDEEPGGEGCTPTVCVRENGDTDERPENVIGSYAVYHKTKSDHKVGETNYATGKAFHIFRPKAIDADGKEAWAELSYTDGKLSVIVPQAFLDSAAYPVKVDPTFGYSTVGGSSTSNLVEDSMRITKPFAPSSSGMVTQIHAYTDNNDGVGGSITLRGVLYTDAGARVAYTTEFTGSGTFAWRDMTVSPIVSVVSGTNYKVGMWFPAPRLRTRFDSTGASSGFNFQRDNETYHATNAPSATWSTASESVDRKNSFYATYIEPAGGFQPVIWFD